MIGLICIEGAGQTADYPDSFMKSLSHNWNHGGWSYIYPHFSVNVKAGYAYGDALKMSKKEGNEGLFIAGYGQGGAAAIKVCESLSRDNIRVDCLALFDAVSPSQNIDVPANVDFVLHGYRASNTLSRPTLTNCGRFCLGAGRRKMVSFSVTHWGAGGAGYFGNPHGYPNPNDRIYESVSLGFSEQSNPSGSSFVHPTAVDYATDWSEAQRMWSWLTNEVNQEARAVENRAWSQSPKNQGKPNIGAPSNGAPGNGQPATGTMYTVASGDSLSLISGRFWKDVLLWPILYDANRSVVGPNPNLIQPGQKLRVPSIAGYNKSQLDAARQRGRQC